jgi:tRNA nucleotidyltransferase/poly(A) polymerase
MQIPKDILEIHAKFIAAGKELFLVGGCVRDFKLGLEPKDYDMATNAYPEEIEAILEGHEMDLTGKNCGVMRIRTTFDPNGFEIATYREDESAGRKPVVKIGSTLENDAWRRDFTINALYYNISTKEIIDPTGGVKDLEDRVIRACGDPIKRINDDALRMLRAVRFKNTIGGTYDPSLREAMLANPVLQGPDKDGNIVPISQERISEEFLKGLNKTFNMDLVDQYVKDLMEFQFLGQVFRGLHINDSFTCHWREPELMIADLLRFNTNHKDLYVKLVDVCKFSKDITEGVLFLLDLEDIDEDKAYKLRSRMDSKTNLTRDDIIRYSGIMTENGKIGRVHLVHAFSNYKITTSGDALKEEGFVDGPELGAEKEKREKQIFINILESANERR